MGIFTFAIVLLDIPFIKKMLQTRNEELKISAESYTFQRGQRPRGNQSRTNKLFTDRGSMNGFLPPIIVC
jgi:hypothetical protein